eukprot:CAMPEP_0198326680 /NCGR_PEP_ID=MMETSP1450-20131203/14136_1 /TAXON_ID=753684 ORGANISM="Madagascaria erythrocladiodes, Strain CCMP3234" /NCGR_SAMPLE_ID=MMETSP1450 /ASSEMBLY_ACC=CAM_ASM_001115 /LENGTH=214 /DNA_ID=CAMNT_0044030657 /DNA_START=585 /DNA_END=1230 /DNA_ORIENTATION=-
MAKFDPVELNTAKSFAEAWASVLKYMEDQGGYQPLIIAHNAAFDRGFVYAELALAGLQVPEWTGRALGNHLWPHSGRRGCEEQLSSSSSEVAGFQELRCHYAGDDLRVLSVVLNRAATMLEKPRVDNSRNSTDDTAKQRSAVVTLMEARASKFVSSPTWLGFPSRKVSSESRSDRWVLKSSSRQASHNRKNCVSTTSICSNGSFGGGCCDSAVQ